MVDAVSYAFDDAARARVTSLLADRKLCVITGAGISTDSGIPDYRGSGTKIRSRIDFASFVAQAHVRQRYWLRAYFGWDRFASAQPNRGHLAIAALGQAGLLTGVVTQNVDGLHRDAGSNHVVELHGNLARLQCLECGQKYDRQSFHLRFIESNPWLRDVAGEDVMPLGPDGDTAIEVLREVTVPACTVCGGNVKPDVVFFGEFVPPKIFNAANDLVKRADALVVAGSSLAVNSAVRLVETARRRRKSIVVINRGETKIDHLATIRFEAGCTEVLEPLARTLGAADLVEDIE